MNYTPMHENRQVNGELSQAEIGEVVRKQAVRDREEAMSVLIARHGESLKDWPAHIRAHYERLKAAQVGSGSVR